MLMKANIEASQKDPRDLLLVELDSFDFKSSVRNRNSIHKEQHRQIIEARSGRTKSSSSSAFSSSSSSSSSSSGKEKEIVFSFGQMTADVEEDMLFLTCEYLKMSGLELRRPSRAMDERFLTPHEILTLDSLLNKH